MELRRQVYLLLLVVALLLVAAGCAEEWPLAILAGTALYAVTMAWATRRLPGHGEGKA